MNFPLIPAQLRPTTRHHDAFTLIELIAVMAIILILAGLILGIASHAQQKGSLTRAQTEVRALGSAIENYKIDNGVYPENDDTDNLNPLQDFDPVGNNKYKMASAYLYQELSGLHTSASAGGTTTVTKSYFTFQPNQLEIAVGAPASVTTRTPTSAWMYIADPFGFGYGYSTAYLKAAALAASGPTPGATPIPGSFYNPTFDLWSTAGYSPTGGRGTPANAQNSNDATVYSSLWIKNW